MNAITTMQRIGRLGIKLKEMFFGLLIIPKHDGSCIQTIKQHVNNRKTKYICSWTLKRPVKILLEINNIFSIFVFHHGRIYMLKDIRYERRQRRKTTTSQLGGEDEKRPLIG